MNDLDTGVFDSHTEYERQRNVKSYFWRVINGYLDVCAMSPIVATSYDPSIKNPKLGADLIHFLADVELATRKALGNNPSAIEQWRRLVRGENVPNALSIISRCARLYQARRLAPVLYFHTVKRGRPGRQPIAVTQAA